MTCSSILLHSLMILDVNLKLCPLVTDWPSFPGVQFEEAFLTPTLPKPLTILNVSIISLLLRFASKVMRPRLDNQS